MCDSNSYLVANKQLSTKGEVLRNCIRSYFEDNSWLLTSDEYGENKCQDANKRIRREYIMEVITYFSCMLGIGAGLSLLLGFLVVPWTVVLYGYISTITLGTLLLLFTLDNPWKRYPVRWEYPVQIRERIADYVRGTLHNDLSFLEALEQVGDTKDKCLVGQIRGLMDYRDVLMS